MENFRLKNYIGLPLVRGGHQIAGYGLTKRAFVDSYSLSLSIDYEVLCACVGFYFLSRKEGKG